MQIIDPCVVSLSWRLEDAHGHLIDELVEPVEFLVGGDDLLSKVEEALIGQDEGYEAIPAATFAAGVLFFWKGPSYGH